MRWKTLEIKTRKKVDFLDITELIRDITREHNHTGMVNVFVPHTTAAVILSEMENNLLHDMEELLERLIPELHPYHHYDGNAHAHLRSALLGNSVNIPCINGELLLGTWQRVILVESDGPRERRVIVSLY